MNATVLLDAQASYVYAESALGALDAALFEGALPKTLKTPKKPSLAGDTWTALFDHAERRIDRLRGLEKHIMSRFFGGLLSEGEAEFRTRRITRRYTQLATRLENALARHGIDVALPDRGV